MKPKRKKPDDSSQLDDILQRRKDRHSQQVNERAAEMVTKRQRQRWADAWRAMAEPKQWQPTCSWSDESTRNLSNLAEAVHQSGSVEVVQRIAERIARWLATDDPLANQRPVATVIATGPKMIEYMEGMVSCCYALLAAVEKDTSRIDAIIQGELLNRDNWRSLGREVSANPDLPMDPVPIGPRIAKCGICRNEWPLADDHTGPVLCSNCESIASGGPTAIVPDMKTQAIGWWNDGATWREVNLRLGRDAGRAKATQMELTRFANKNGIEIRKGKPGRRPTGEMEQ